MRDRRAGAGTVLELRRPARELLRPGDRRIFYSNTWFRGHNNPRYERLLPRLTRLDMYLLVCPAAGWRRGLAARAVAATRPVHQRVLLGIAATRYRYMFTTDNRQIELFNGDVVADVDDPWYTEDEVRRLSRANVRGVVVTSAEAEERFRSMGLRTPIAIVPQGVQRVPRAPRRAGAPTFVYVSGFLAVPGDPGSEQLVLRVDHLLNDLWPSIHRRTGGTLVLIGEIGPRALQLARSLPNVAIRGRLPHEEVLGELARADVGLYPRQVDQRHQAVKIADYIGASLPIVTYDLEDTSMARRTGAGMLVDPGDPVAFVDAAVEVVEDQELWSRLSRNAERAAEALSWEALTAQYEVLLDSWLPAR